MRIEELIRLDKEWFIILPNVKTIEYAISISKNLTFWKTNSTYYGWWSNKTPYQKAKEDLNNLSKKEIKYLQWFYEKSGIFSPERMTSSKVGSLCYWICLKSLINLSESSLS